MKFLSPATTGATDAGFPSPKGGGPIEVKAILTARVWSMAFPSPKGGGPIEVLESMRNISRDAILSIAERRWPH